MAESTPWATDVFAMRELDVLRRARTALSAVVDAGEGGDLAWQLVQDVADQLAMAASAPSCPPTVGATLLDWRDRLGSYILAARALAELDVHRGMAQQLLCRGLDEVIEEVPHRLLAVQAAREWA